MCVSHSHARLFATTWTVACQAPLSMLFSRQEYWSGLPCPSSGNLPDPRDQTQVSCIAGWFFTIWTSWEWMKCYSSTILEGDKKETKKKADNLSGSRETRLIRKLGREKTRCSLWTWVRFILSSFSGNRAFCIFLTQWRTLNTENIMTFFVLLRGWPPPPTFNPQFLDFVWFS